MKDYVLLILFVFLFTACSSDETQRPGPDDRTSILEISFAGEDLTRAMGDALPGSENKVNRIALGVFFSDGTVNILTETVLNAENKVIVNCAPGTCDVYAVANAPANLFGGVTTKAAFAEKVIMLGQTASGNVQDADNLPMSGETQGIQLEMGVVARPTLTLSRLVARISLEDLKTAFEPGGQYKDAVFKLDKIFIYNALESSKVAVGGTDNTMPASPVWIHGGRVTAGVWQKGVDYLIDEIVPAVQVTPGGYTRKHWFYAFANNRTSTPTKLVIAGMFDPDGTGPLSEVATYYPVVVNKAQTGTSIIGGGANGGTGTIVRNAEYKLKIIIKSRGVDSPDEEIVPTSMELVVNIAQWELSISQEVIIE